HAGPAYEALKAAVTGPVERVVVPAWEGGHPDHDICAALGAKLAAEHGPIRSLRLSAREWASWLAAVGAFPSQFKAWSGLLPGMAMTFARQGEFRYQGLDPKRIGGPPHQGSLLYERMFRTPYPVIRAAVDALAADGKAPWTTPQTLT
ncbi:MAG TPA: hypothetical protein VHN39_17060, partial [Phenylobacterium sp.]|nr:hypothetical protein [Phenylobacterium sp.]